MAGLHESRTTPSHDVVTLLWLCGQDTVALLEGIIEARRVAVMTMSYFAGVDVSVPCAIAMATRRSSGAVNFHCHSPPLPSSSQKQLDESTRPAHRLNMTILQHVVLLANRRMGSSMRRTLSNLSA